jgi:hypothetical protein
MDPGISWGRDFVGKKGNPFEGFLYMFGAELNPAHGNCAYSVLSSINWVSDTPKELSITDR